MIPLALNFAKLAFVAQCETDILTLLSTYLFSGLDLKNQLFSWPWPRGQLAWT